MFINIHFKRKFYLEGELKPDVQYLQHKLTVLLLN